MHHAYVYEGPLSLLPALRQDAQKLLNLEGENNPDVHAREFEKFGIEESRWLTGAAALRSASGRALFVLGVASITTEAQQALLKLFEEPQKGTTFVLLVPHGALLPTLKSRMLEYSARQHDLKKVLGSPVSAKTAEAGRPDLFANHAAAAFLACSNKERSELITEMLKDDEGVKERVRDFIDELEVILAKDIKKNEQGLADIALVRGYLGDRSPSLKMLLEHLALVV